MKIVNQKFESYLVSSCIVALFSISGCSPDESMVGGGRKKGGESNAESVKEGIDFEEACGINPKDPSDKIVFEQTLRSLPIVVQGVQMGLTYRVTTTANLHITSKVGSGTQDVSVTVDNVETTAGNVFVKWIGTPIAKKKASNQALAASGPKQVEQLPFGQWLNLTYEKPEYKGLVCGLTATKKITDNTDGNGIVEFLPALPNTLNPKASRESIEAEIGDGRTFQVTAEIKSTKEGWPSGTVPGTVTVKPRAPTFTMSDGKSYASDIAYEVIVDFANAPGKKTKPSFATHQLFFINTTSHDFEAIVDLSAPELEDGTKVPPKVMLRTQ